MLNHTIVYIDGQNFLHRCAESLIKSGAIQDQQEITNIDIKHIFKRYINETYEMRFYGITKIKQRQDLGEEFSNKARKYADTLRRIRSNLLSQGVELRDVGQLKIRSSTPCKNCGFIDSQFQEKGVDVGLATEMVKDACMGLVSHAVLASSDIDMLPAIKIVRELGVKVTYVGFKYQINNALVRQSDSTIELHRLTVLEAYVSALNFQNNNKIIDNHQ